MIDDVGVFSRALTNEELEQLAAAYSLTGNEDGLLAGYTFGDVRRESHPAVLSRPVTLATAADISRYVNDYADHPVPVHYVEVSANRDSHVDATMMEIRPSKVHTKPPFGAGEWWRIAQGWEHPAGSHNGTAAYCWDCVRINGPTLGAKIFAAAPGRVSFAVQDASGDEHKNAMSVYHTSAERAVYMHLKEGFYSKFFPNAPSLPPDGAIPEQSQPSFEARDPVVEVGHHPNGDHLHFEVADTSDRTFSKDTAGPGAPAAFSDFYLSRDSGESWKKVALGIPVAGDVIAYYSWSPWSDWRDLGGRLTSGPGAVSWGPNRIDVFVRGHDYQLAHMYWDEGGWSEWRDLDHD